MSAIPPTKSQAMEERIIYLLKRYVSRSLTAEDARELKDFVNSSAYNREVFRNFAMLHKTDIQTAMANRADKETAWHNIISGITTRKRRGLGMRIAAAAVIVLITATAAFIYHDRYLKPKTTLTAMMQTEAKNRAVIMMPNGSSIKLDSKESVQYKDNRGNLLCENKRGDLIYYTQSQEPIYNRVTVDEGSTYKITLPDGTRITLASGSELVYPIGGDKRDVTLKGEALFDVTPDKSRPFTVDCGDDVEVTVLGTRFNISAYSHKPLTVTVESGSVDVSTAVENHILHPGQQISVSGSGQCSVSEVNTGMYTSWASGIYEFDNVPLKDIASELSLWYGIDFEFASHSLEERKFTGVLMRDKNLSYSLSLIKDVSDLEFKTDGEKIVIE